MDGVNLRIAEGEFIAIVGPSGCGKSTILNLLAGLDTPTEGRVEFEGVALSALGRKELAAYRARCVGMVFQSFNLMPHYTAAENVELALYFTDVPRRERRSRAEEILDRLGLADRRTHRPPDLSGGEQQRVAIARALVKSPRILFADEPTGNLDRRNSEEIARLLTRLNGEGLSIVLATHDLEMARTYAHRSLGMSYGRLENSTGSSAGGEGP